MSPSGKRSRLTAMPKLIRAILTCPHGRISPKPPNRTITHPGGMKMQTWDTILDHLSTFQKTADAARVLLDNSQPELACMMLRDTLLRDRKFGSSAPFIEIAKHPAIQEYLFPVPPQT